MKALLGECLNSDDLARTSIAIRGTRVICSQDLSIVNAENRKLLQDVNLSFPAPFQKEGYYII